MRSCLTLAFCVAMVLPSGGCLLRPAPAGEAAATPSELRQRLDAVAAGYAREAASVLGSAAGAEVQDPSFDRAEALEAEAYTSANASVGDLDGDGHIDIVLAKGRHWSLAQAILFNDGGGRFERRYDLNHADRTYTAALADVNGDGSLDLVVGNDARDEKLVYFNDGRGRFSRAGTFGEPDWPTRNLTLADLDGDGFPDIVVANRGGPDRSANSICINDGRGRFPDCRELSRESATTVAAGDLTGNGLPDLLVPHRDGGQSYVFVNDGAGRFEERHPIGPVTASTRAVALGDLDGDGLLDVVLGDEPGGGAWIYLNRGRLVFEEAIRIGQEGQVVYSMAVADLSGDGSADIVLGHLRAPGAVLINDGMGRAFRIVPFGDSEGAVYGLAIADVNGDGRLDIVAARSGAASMLYFNGRP